MSFLSLIIALALRYLWEADRWLQRDGWWRAWRRRALDFDLLPWLRLALTVGLPVLAVLLLLALLKPLLFGLLWLVAAVLVLLYALGRGDFPARIARYRDYCSRDNAEGAWLYLRQELGLDVPGAVDPGLEPAQLHRVLQARLYYDGYQRWFAVVFYFLLLGPAAALAYRLLQLYREDEGDGPARSLLFLLDWVPTRLLVATFTLTGDFVRSRDPLLAALADPGADSESLLLAVGIAAATAETAPSEILQAAEDVSALAGLLTRSAVAWVVVIALVAILA